MMSLEDNQQILEKALKEELYAKLIMQLNKDFKGIIDHAFQLELKPLELIQTLKVNLEHLLSNNNIIDLQNLLYRIDVSEQKIKSIETDNTQEYINQLSFLILRREWQKVWFKNIL